MTKKSKKSTGGKSGTTITVPFPLQGVPEVLETELAGKVYKDGLQKPFKAASEVATELIHGFRLFTAPFALAARFAIRLSSDLEQCRLKVPLDRQVESPPEIAGPIIQALRFTDDTNPLRRMFLNLLTASIDREKQSNIHPAFVSILPQLSPDEAKLLYILRGGAITGVLGPMLGTMPVTSVLGTIPVGFPERLPMYVSRLEAFALVGREDGGVEAQKILVKLTLTEFGTMFLDVVG